MSDKNIFETDNLAICPYLTMNGLKYISIRRDPTNKKYLFIFEDPEYSGTDLVASFLKSKEYDYKKYWSFFRNELAKQQEKDGNNYEKLEK